MAGLKPPAGMSAGAAKLFKQLVEEVDHRWESYHSHALALYCETWEELAKVRRMFRKLKQSEILIVRSDGQQQMTPLLGVIKEYSKLLRELGAELGLSPVSEAKSKLDGPPASAKSDDLAKMEAAAEAKRRV